MIISRTPYRISFFGGGTDYPAWYLKHGGTVLATAIDKYCYLTCRYLPPFFEHKYRAVWSKIENCQQIAEIEHPAIREILRFMKMSRGVEIHHVGDLPARSGMGSSSTFTVGLLHALYALRGYMPTKHQLAMESIEIEQELIKETVGSQDQVLAAYGGFNQLIFHRNGEISVRPVVLTSDRVQELNSHLMLFYSGIKRTAADVASTYVNDLDDKKRQLRIMKDLVDEGISLLNSSQDIKGFGDLLHESWQAKRSLSASISNEHVDLIYEKARKAGAIGGKIAGAGGGGFMLLFAPPERHQKIKSALGNMINVPFKFDFTGSQIIYYQLEEDYSGIEQEREKQVIDTARELSSLTPISKTTSKKKDTPTYVRDCA
ncbi:GHMP family kinase ATP-binding protein [Geomonas edaphica]|uniref:GHMP family kinase ATP-binding protein n=1 Tax=Geomonas edaphica TaxID=2570226 RepID=UPI0010A9023D|nr:kinase [Geomonas edaphica]